MELIAMPNDIITDEMWNSGVTVKDEPITDEMWNSGETVKPQGIDNQTIMDFNSEKDDDIKAKAIIKDRMDDLDPEGEVYFDKLMDPKATMQLLQKVTDPQPMDAKELDEILMTGRSPLSPKMVPATSPDEEKHSIDPEGGYVSITKPDTTEEPKGPSMREATDADFQRSWGDIFSNFFKYGTANEEYVRVRERMEASLPDIGKAVKLAKREEKRKTVKAKMSGLSDFQKAAVDGLMSAIKKPALGISYLITDKMRLDESGFDLGFQEALANDVNIWSEALGHSEELKKEWKENEGWNWTRPSYITDFILRSGPTMALSMYTGGALAAGAKGAVVRLALYGGGSGFTEATAESGAAVAQAEAMGASDEEKMEVAQTVFQKNFIESAIFNSLQYGTGSLQKALKNKLLKTFAIGTGVMLEPQQELRQDEISNRAINEIVAKKVVEDNYFMLDPRRTIEGLIDPEKRDLTMLSVVMGAFDPAVGYIQDIKANVSKTGKGKAVLDTNVNYTEKGLQQELEAYEAYDGELGPIELQRYEALKENAEDVTAATPKLFEIDAKAKTEFYKKNTIEGILEDATLGSEVKSQLANLPDPEAAATAEQINDTLDVFNEVGLKNEDSKMIRDVYGLKKLSQGETLTTQASLRNAKLKGFDQTALEIAKESLANPDRLISADEYMGLLIREAELQNRHDDILKERSKLDKKKDKEAWSSLTKQTLAIEKNIDTITEAAERGGTNVSHSLRIRQARINRATYDLTNMRKTARALSGKELTPAESEVFRKDAEKIKELEKEVEQLREKSAELEEAILKKNSEKTIAEMFDKKKRALKKEDLQKRRTSLKAELKKMGHRVNDITGVTVEATKLIGMLAETYVQEGVTQLPELIEKLSNDLPDVKERTFYESLDNRRRNVIKKAKTGTKAVLKELKKQASWKLKVMDAMNGIFDPKREIPPNSKEVKQLVDLFEELRRSHFQTETDLAKVDMIQRKLDDVMLAIEKNTVIPKEKRTRVESDMVLQAKKKLKDAMILMETNEKIRDLEKQLETGEFKLPVKKEKIVVGNDLDRARLDLYRKKREVRERLLKMKPLTIGTIANKIGGSLRSSLASMDVSYIARQGGFMTPAHPKIAMKALHAANQALLSKEMNDRIAMEIVEHPNHFYREKHKLALTDLGDGLTKQEEFFGDSFLENFPGIAASGRHMRTGLNVMRVLLFDSFMERHPGAKDEVLDAYAMYTNSSTGRGSLGSMERAARALSGWAFAARWATSRLQMGFLTPQNWKLLKHKEIRHEMAKDYAAFFTSWASIMLMAKASGQEVELDPRSPDFGRIIFENGMRVELPSGMAGTFRLMGIMTGALFNTFGAADKKTKDPLRKVGSFLKYKASPTVSLAAQIISGRYLTGQKVEWKETEKAYKDPDAWAEWIFRNTAPISAQTAFDMYGKKYDVDTAIIGMLFESIGMNTQVYGDKKKKGSTIPLKDL